MNEVFSQNAITENKINIEEQGEKLQKGLAKLVLTVVELLRQVLERQAQKRINSGSLSKMETEKLGIAFMQIKQKLTEISNEFGIESKDLNISLDSLLSKELRDKKATLVDVLDKLIDKKAVVAGQISISVANIDLVILDVIAALSSPTNQNSQMELKYD